MKTFQIYTFGCKVNAYESVAFAEKLKAYGLVKSKTPDLCLIHSCTVTHGADSKVLQCIRRLRRQFPESMLVVLGCLTELDAEKMRKFGVNLILPYQRKYDVFFELGLTLQKKVFAVWDLTIGNFPLSRAYLKIQDGCDNRCSFCKVRVVRGASISRPFPEIIAEAKRLIHKGFSEIVLCGVNILFYGKEQGNGQAFQDLLDVLCALPGLGRIRLSSLEPQQITPQFLWYILNHQKICQHFHIPFQSGDGGILASMKRSVDPGCYEGIIHEIRKINSLAGISCDLIVGFPGETDKAFQRSVDLLERIQPVRTHIFPFSPRESTQAFLFPGSVDRNSVRKRIEILKNKALYLEGLFYQRFVGRTCAVVFEQKKRGDFYCGYSGEYLKVHVKESAHVSPGRILPVRIEKVENGIAFGVLDKGVDKPEVVC